jgi:hypothetical protein
MMDDDLPEGEWPPKLLMSDFSAQMLDVETPGSPLWLVDRVTLLLKADRIGPALKLLEELPGAITGTAEAIYAEGREMGRMAAEKAAASAPTSMHAAIELAEHIARLGADRVAEVLSVRLVDLQPMLEGRVQPPKAGMRRLRTTSR